MARKIAVKLARLTEALRTINIVPGTTLKAFLEKEGISRNGNVRVNAERKTGSYKLKKDDIVTVVTAVSGGLV